MSEIPTCWYLKREPVGIVLVVEQIPAPHYGFCIPVETRQDARAYLPLLREQLTGGLVLVREPMRTYDPVEDGG